MTYSSLLTPRQAEFLALTAQGFTGPQIALLSSFSPWTVKDALDEARRRLNARTLPQAVAKAIAYEEVIIDHDGFVWAPLPRKLTKLINSE